MIGVQQVNNLDHVQGRSTSGLYPCAILFPLNIRPVPVEGEIRACETPSNYFGKAVHFSTAACQVRLNLLGCPLQTRADFLLRITTQCSRVRSSQTLLGTRGGTRFRARQSINGPRPILISQNKVSHFSFLTISYIITYIHARLRGYAIY